MGERKYVKFRVDMFDDTKFKIIDMKPERDLIHYVWTRLVTLARKVNLEGALYLSKNIPYTLETLAIEFNRNIDQIKLALNVLIELEMIEFNENNIYRVKNFAKHQNIKISEKIKYKDSDKNNNNNDVIKNKEASINKNANSEIIDNKNNKTENKTNINEVQTNVENNTVNNLETNYINDKDSSKSDDNISNDKPNHNSNNNTTSNDNIPITLKTKKIKKSNKSNNKNNSIDITDENTEDNLLCWFSDGEEEQTLGEGERVIGNWSF